MPAPRFPLLGLLALAGLPIPEAMQGTDLTPLLEGRDVAWRTAFLYEFFARQGTWLPPQFGVRTRWRRRFARSSA